MVDGRPHLVAFHWVVHFEEDYTEINTQGEAQAPPGGKALKHVPESQGGSTLPWGDTRPPLSPASLGPVGTFSALGGR